MMERLIVQLQSRAEAEFAGHVVSARFMQRLARDQTVANVVAAAVDGKGRAVIEFPGERDEKSDVTLDVTAPDGQRLREQNVPAELVGAREPFVIEVDAKKYFPIEPNTDPAFGRPTRLRGVVVDPQGKGHVAGLQIVISAAVAANRAAMQIVAVAKSDARGYFSIPYPSGDYASAEATVGGGAAVPIQLEAPGRFPERVVLAAEARTEPDTKKDDCACKTSVQRDPDQHDLVASPESFTDDAGGGHCIDFTKPNRVLEEFDFYTVVRTTEPQIHGLTLTDPPKIPLRDLVGILDPQIYSLLLRSQPEERLFREEAATVVDGGAPVRTTRAARGAPEPSMRRLDPDDAESLASRALVTAKPELEHLSEVIGLTSVKVAQKEKTDLRDVHIEANLVRSLAADPDGFSLTRLAQAEVTTRKNDLLRLVQLIGKKGGGRGNLTCQNSIDWDDEPTFYQACTIAHGQILHLKQQWVADGYSLGDLLYSLPLAPCQKKQIAVVDWDRRDTGARAESIEEREQLQAFISRDRDISEIANAAVRESMTGGSSASTSSFGAGLGIAGGLFGGAGFLGGVLGIGGGTSGASSNAWQNSSRSTSASSLQQLRDVTVQGASSVRGQRSTVIQTVRQGESVRVETDVVANHNHCHTMTIQYFEVLRHFLVRVGLADVQECLLVPLLMSRFDSAKARRWRESLSLYCRNRKLLGGFDALQRIADNYVGSDMPVGAYAEEDVIYLDGFLRLQFRIQRPRDKDDGSFLEATWNVLSWLGFNPREFWENQLREQAQRDRVFAEVLGPRIAEEISNGLRILAVGDDNNETPLPIDLTLVSDFANDQPLYVSLRLRADLPPLRRDRIRFIKIATMVDTKAGPKSIDDILPAGSRLIVHSGQLGYRTAHIANDLFRHSSILDDLSGDDGVLIYTPLSRQELRRPRDEDKELANALLKHLNDHLEYYHRAIWWRMDAQRRYMLLDGFIAPNSGGRSVASVVENRLVGIIGNCLVMPVALGFHLDPTFRQDLDNPIDLLEHYQPETPPAPVRVAVPTKGVFAEAAMGACNSCEKTDESRFWRWEESPCPDDPTPIQPPSTESRRADMNLTPQPLPAPIVAFQNTPAAPDPQGFGPLAQLIGNPNLFRDITGLTENQKNALAGLQAALSTAQFFGGKATDLALQASMRRDVDKALNKINEQHENGAITDEQRKQLTESALRSMIGGGPEAPTSNALTSQPEVRDAIRNAGSTPGGSVNLTRATGGATETVGVSTPAEADLGRSFIIEAADLTAERRAFNPGTRDKSGQITMSVRVPRLPTGGSVRWSIPPIATGHYTLSGKSTQLGNRVEITALQPGLTEIDVEVRDAAGSTLESEKYRLSIPQFVTVDVDATFRNVLTTQFNLLDVEMEEVLTEAKNTCDTILSTANVRTIWRMAPFNEVLPPQFGAGGIAAANVTRVLLQGDPPSAALYGRTTAAAGGIGPAVFNEAIDVWVGAFDDPVTGHANQDVDDVTNEVVQTIVAVGPASSPEKALAMSVVGRLVGETTAHEIVHSLIGATLSDGGHNAHPGLPSDLMNHGRDRSFQSRTGFEITGTIAVDTLTSILVDHGIFFINIPTTDSLTEINATFPVPPAFT